MKALVMVLLGCSALAFASGVSVFADEGQQDPVRTARPPKEPKILRPIIDPVGIDRRDLVDGVLPPTMLEGTWELVDSRIRGRRDLGVRGALIATRTHLVVHLQFVAGNDVRVQSSWRRYRFDGGDLVMSTVAGHSDLIDGELKHELPGVEDRRKFRSFGTKIRLERGANDFMEFVRVE